MLENMSSTQFMNWLNYYNQEPWGYEIENYRAGIIASAVLNSVRGKKSDKVWTYKDFFITNHTNNYSQTWQEQFSIAKSISAAFSRKEERY